MVLRGFYNDNSSVPGRSSSGVERRKDIARVLRKGGAVRSVYDRLEPRIPIEALGHMPGVEQAGIVAARVHFELSGEGEHRKAFSVAEEFTERYKIPPISKSSRHQ